MRLVAVGVAALAIAAAASAENWQPMGRHVLGDTQSIQRDATGFTMALRYIHLDQDGLPPPLVSTLVHMRFDCAAHTNRAIDIVYYAAGDRVIGEGHYPPQALRTNPGSVPDAIEKRFCVAR
jgi:hypothetical protein